MLSNYSFSYLCLFCYISCSFNQLIVLASNYLRFYNDLGTISMMLYLSLMQNIISLLILFNLFNFSFKRLFCYFRNSINTIGKLGCRCLLLQNITLLISIFLFMYFNFYPILFKNCIFLLSSKPIMHFLYLQATCFRSNLLTSLINKRFSFNNSCNISLLNNISYCILCLTIFSLLCLHYSCYFLYNLSLLIVY